MRRSTSLLLLLISTSSASTNCSYKSLLGALDLHGYSVHAGHLLMQRCFIEKHQGGPKYESDSNTATRVGGGKNYSQHCPSCAQIYFIFFCCFFVIILIFIT